MPYFLDLEIRECILMVREILDDLLDIKLALLFEEDLTHLICPTFNPFLTVGKYE